MSDNEKITNAEYMISILMGILEDNNIDPHPPIYIDYGGASEEAMIHYHIKCPYLAGDKRGKCTNEKIYSPTREQCFECKRDWLTNEADE